MERANPVSFASQERERCGSTLSFGPERKDCQMSRKVGGDRVELIAFLQVLGRGRVSGITYWNWLNAGPGAPQNRASRGRANRNGSD